MASLSSTTDKLGALAGCGCLTLILVAIGMGAIGDCRGDSDPFSSLNEILEAQSESASQSGETVPAYDSVLSIQASNLPARSKATPLPTSFEQTLAVEAATRLVWSPQVRFIAEETGTGVITVFARGGSTWIPAFDISSPADPVVALSLTDSGFITLGFASGAVELHRLRPTATAEATDSSPAPESTMYSQEYLVRLPELGAAAIAVATNEAGTHLAFRAANDSFHLYQPNEADPPVWSDVAYWEFTEAPPEERGFVTELIVAEDGTVAEGTVDGLVRVFYEASPGSRFARWWVPRSDDPSRITSLALSNHDYLAVGDAKSNFSLYRYQTDPDETFAWLTSFVWVDEGLVTAIAVDPAGDFLWGTTSGAISVHQAGGLEFSGEPAWWDTAPAGPILAVWWAGEDLMAVNGFGHTGVYSPDAEATFIGTWDEQSPSSD